MAGGSTFSRQLSKWTFEELPKSRRVRHGVSVPSHSPYTHPATLPLLPTAHYGLYPASRFAPAALQRYPAASHPPFSAPLSIGARARWAGRDMRGGAPFLFLVLNHGGVGVIAAWAALTPRCLRGAPMPPCQAANLAATLAGGRWPSWRGSRLSRWRVLSSGAVAAPR